MPEAVDVRALVERSRIAEAINTLFVATDARDWVRTYSGRNTRVFVGSYDFHLQLRDAGWRIDLFRFKVKFVDGNLELEKEASA